MAISKSAKVQAEIEKARVKLAEQQTRLKELEVKKTEFENLEIVDMVRGMSIPLDNLAAILQTIKNGVAIAPAAASGQVDPKPTAPVPEINSNDMEEEIE